MKKKVNSDRTYIVESGSDRPKKDESKFYVPMAELIHRQETRLPDRFRYKPVEIRESTTCMSKTVPQGPRLATYARKGKTRRELEGEKIRQERLKREEESFKRPQFVARKYCFSSFK